MTSQPYRHRPRPDASTAPSRLWRLLLAVAALALLLGPATLVVAAPPAAAADPDQSASITLDAMSPSIVTDRSDADQEITITGRVTNVGKAPIVRPQVFFWRSLDPITDAEGFQQTLDSAATDPIGSRVQEETWVDLFTAKRPELAPGRSQAFSVSVTFAQLTLPPVNGVFLVGVHVREDYSTTVGRARLFLPVSDENAAVTDRNTVKMASLVLLSSRPALLFPAVPAREERPATDAVFADDHLAAEIAPGGRLDELIDDAGRPGMSTAIDPDLVAELEQLVAGYQVRAADGTLTDGEGGTDAGRWLDRLDDVLAGQDAYRLPYASLDLAALTHHGPTAVIEASEAAAAEVDRTRDLPLLALPAGGLADRDTVDAAADLSPRAILLSDSVTDGRGPLLRGPSDIPIVTFTSTSATGGPGPDPSDTATHLRQAFLASSWIDEAGSAPGTSLGSVRLISDPDDAGAAEVAAAPWIRQTTVGDLLSGTPRTAPTAYTYPVSATDEELTAPQLDGVSAIAGLQTVYSRLTQADDNVAAAAAARAASSAWRDQALISRPWAGTQIDQLRDDIANGVVLSGGPEPRLTTRNSVFPLTVTNKLDQPVTVELRFSSPNAQRLSIRPVEDDQRGTLEAFTLEPGESRQVTNQAVARTNGTFAVTAQLYTTDNRRVGQSYPMQVHAANVGFVGWVIVIASGITLVGATAFRIRQVARERRGSEPDAVGNGEPAARADQEHGASV